MLPLRCILLLVAILMLETLRGLLGSNSKSESSYDLKTFTAIRTQTNFCHITSFKVALYSACNLTKGDYIRYFSELSFQYSAISESQSKKETGSLSKSAKKSVKDYIHEDFQHMVHCKIWQKPSLFQV